MTQAATAATPLASWSGERVRVGEVLAALESLRKGEERIATRTAVVNLVVVAREGTAGRTAAVVAHSLGNMHPGRTLVLCADKDAEPAGIDAEVAIRADLREGVAVWSEAITLRLSGPTADHLDSLIEPLTLPDLPVAVWFPDSVPRPGDGLLDAADAVLVDSKEHPDFDRLAALAPETPLIDLAWVRLEPWRALLAGVFDRPAFRGRASAVTEAEVAGKPPATALLAGWLVSRLDLPRARVRRVTAAHASMTLVAPDPARPFRVHVTRGDDDRVVRAIASAGGDERHEEAQALPEDSAEHALAAALATMRPDPVYAETLPSVLAVTD